MNAPRFAGGGGLLLQIGEHVPGPIDLVAVGQVRAQVRDPRDQVPTSLNSVGDANGKSAQRQNDNSVQIAAPTPKDANHAGTKSPACATASQFTGVRIPTQTVTVKKGKAPVLVKCPAKAKGHCKGTLVLKTAHKVMTASGKKKIVTLGSASFTIAAGKSAKVAVPLTKAGKNLVANHKSVSAIATATAHDGSGKTKKTSGNVTLKRPPKKD